MYFSIFFIISSNFCKNNPMWYPSTNPWCTIIVKFIKHSLFSMLNLSHVNWGIVMSLEYGVINPKIISHSEELTYLPGGEGCLSVDREVQGLIHRPKKITVEFDNYDFETGKISHIKLRLKGYISVVFQHENDHLYGKLFFDHINKDMPLYVPENSKPIRFDFEKEE